MILFLALLALGIAISGFGAFVIFWPLTLVHLRDRHAGLSARLGKGALFNPSSIGWLMRSGYRSAGDPSLSGLATPAKVSIYVTLTGAIFYIGLKLLALVMAT